MKNKTNKIHKVVWINRKPYYRCNTIIGNLSGQQLIFKTNEIKKRRVTCKKCLKWKYISGL